MKIKELFDKDITRRINPAVVVSEMDEYFINQEIDEYVFTPAITKNIYKFLDAIANKKEGKTGVWISGYYGSGKSHFIKYLFYCLQPIYSAKAMARFNDSIKNLDPLDEPTPGQVAALHSKLSKLTFDEIIFNIDYVSDRDDAKDRITRVLLNQINNYRGYNNTNIALALYLEKPLDKAGHFDQFKDRIKAKYNENWSGNQIRFVRRYLSQVIDIACEFDPAIDKQSLHSSIMERNQDYTIEFLIAELLDYLKNKPENHRLLFLIDEVSQYIGSDTSLLLNLQTIVEEIGSQIGTKVWIVCTAQQELSNLVKASDDKSADFGKIFGRIETMISLESQDAAYITKKRVLDKKSEGIGALNDYYKSNKGAIENQFVFDHDLYSNFSNRDDFTLTYPFIPYQFRLISDVFESFSNIGYVGEGVKNTERSILGITHFTANLCKDLDVGFFVPFDLFFNEQLEKNLSHHARNILDRAYNIAEVKSDAFARRVVNTLFMISNLGDTKSINLPANIENLSLLLMDAVDIPKAEIQKKVQKVLDVLVEKNIIQESEGKYRFLKEDEIEVAILIKNTPVAGEDRLSYFYEDIILRIIKPEAVVSYGSRNFRIALQVDDKQIGQKGDFNLKFLVFDNSELTQIAHLIPSNDMVVGICEWFSHERELKDKILDYIRTRLYIRLNSSTATGTRFETLNNFKESNNQLLRDIHLRFEKMFMETGFVSNNQVISAEELNTSSPPTRFQQMLNRHMENVYRKHQLAGNYATSNAALISSANARQVQLHKALLPAEEEVESRIGLEGGSPVAGDIVKIFEKAPYGWKDVATLDVLLQLAKKGYRRFEWRGEEIDFATYADKALNSRERDAITIHKERTVAKEDVEAFISLVNNVIFAETLVPSNSNDFKHVVETFKSKLQPKIASLNKLKDEYESWGFSIHLKNYYNALSQLYQSRNNEELMRLVIEKKQTLIVLRDASEMLVEFIGNNFSDYESIAEFVQHNNNNFDSLDDMLQVKANELVHYLKSDTDPWERFPQMKKAFREIQIALSAHIEKLRSQIISAYETIFREIEERRNHLDISEPNLTTEPSLYLSKIRKEKQIAQLEIFKLKASEFKATNFRLLDDYKARRVAKISGGEYNPSVEVSIVSEMPPTTIETAEQLDEYLKKLREKLMVKLAKNKKLFIN